MGDLTKPRQIFKDVRGAPFKIGTSVRVVRLADETGDRAWPGCTGTVKFLNYDCGCGQTYPSDPMIGVELPSGKVEEFWKEELCPVLRRVRSGKHSASPDEH
jgi:hypothetical protein